MEFSLAFPMEFEVFDEFQDLLLLGQNLDKKVRAKIQYHSTEEKVNLKA